VSTGGQAVGEADGAVVGALLRASTSLTTLDLSGSSCAPEAARLIGEGLRESAAHLAELRLANVWNTTDGRMLKKLGCASLSVCLLVVECFSRSQKNVNVNKLGRIS
jgi:Ran GTPase-activating protein (RanGAP) involved in mRNA processing and transport